MGRVACAAIERRDDLELVGGFAFAPRRPISARAPVRRRLALYDETKPDVVVDFTVYPVTVDVAREAVERRISPVIGATGWTDEDRSASNRCATCTRRTPAMLVPNFAFGAVLMMRFAAQAAPLFPNAEIVELHHDGKRDAPSGTAKLTAQRIATAPAHRARPDPQRAAAGLVAHQECSSAARRDADDPARLAVARVVHAAASCSRCARCAHSAAGRRARCGSLDEGGSVKVASSARPASSARRSCACSTSARVRSTRSARTPRATREPCVFAVRRADRRGDARGACATAASTSCSSPRATTRARTRRRGRRRRGRHRQLGDVPDGDGVPLDRPRSQPARDPSVEHRIFPVANCTAIVLCVALAPIARASAAQRARRDLSSRQRRRARRSRRAGRRRAPIGGWMAPNGPSRARSSATSFRKSGSYRRRRRHRRREEGRRRNPQDARLPICTSPRRPCAFRSARAQRSGLLRNRRGDRAVELGARSRRAGRRLSPDGIVTPRDVEDSDLVHVARLRAEEGRSSARTFQLWVVGDQLRKGAATNAVQILELLSNAGKAGSQATMDSGHD
jgi:4-hydroxy-tetrahydrodipicolinate reductase